MINPDPIPDPELVLDALADISEQRQGSFAVFTADADRNLYAQFLADADAGLLVEIVGDTFLAPPDRLTSLQQADMRARGWTLEPGSNWHRRWSDDSNDRSRNQIALDALATLREVYGATDNVDIRVQLEGRSVLGDAPPTLQSVDAPSASPHDMRRLALYVAVFALLLTLGIALVVSSLL